MTPAVRPEIAVVVIIGIPRIASAYMRECADRSADQGADRTHDQTGRYTGVG
jgi:hypothetical protein